MIAGALKVLGGISIGVGIGQQWARAELDRYYRKKGEEFVSQQYRAMQDAFMAREKGESPVEHEHELDDESTSMELLHELNNGGLDEPDTSDFAIVVGGTALLEEQIARLDPDEYQKASADYMVPGVTNSISYISEDEYNEDDGNAKEQITIFLQAGQEEPLFVLGGDTIQNWSELIGDTILVDFFRMFQPTETERVLYVRNHERGEDYEVFQAMG